MSIKYFVIIDFIYNLFVYCAHFFYSSGEKTDRIPGNGEAKGHVGFGLLYNDTAVKE